MSLDPVAIESVGYDFLRTEWDGVNKHDAVNNEWESMPNAYGVDDYMHQAADTANWPKASNMILITAASRYRFWVFMNTGITRLINSIPAISEPEMV